MASCAVGAVVSGVDVGAADQHETVELLHDLVGLRVGDVPFEQRRLLAAGTPHGVEVAPRHDQRVGSAAGLVAGRKARRDSDERAHRLPVYSRSKPLRSSQSVTCWLNQLHSCFAVLSR